MGYDSDSDVEVEYMAVDRNFDRPNLHVGGSRDIRNGNRSGFVGVQTGGSAQVTSVRERHRLSNSSTLTNSGPSARISGRARVGTETSVGVVAEASLARTEYEHRGKHGTFTAWNGVSATTGVKYGTNGVQTSVLGLGVDASTDGVSISTPFGGLGYKR